MKKQWDWMVTKEWLEVTYCFAVSSVNEKTLGLDGDKGSNISYCFFWGGHVVFTNRAVFVRLWHFSNQLTMALRQSAQRT